MADKEKTQQKKHCDNHPDEEATLVTDDDGAHSEIALCEECKSIAGR